MVQLCQFCQNMLVKHRKVNICQTYCFYNSNNSAKMSENFNFVQIKPLRPIHFHDIRHMSHFFSNMQMETWQRYQIVIKTKLEKKFGSGRNTHFYLPIYFILVLVVIGTMGCTVLCCYTFFVFNNLLIKHGKIQEEEWD